MNSIQLQLYITGQSTFSRLALTRLEALINRYPEFDFDLDVIDVLEAPHRAAEEKVIATPTLIKIAPAPRARVIGDFQGHDHLSELLGLQLLQHGVQHPDPGATKG